MKKLLITILFISIFVLTSNAQDEKTSVKKESNTSLNRSDLRKENQHVKIESSEIQVEMRQDKVDTSAIHISDKAKHQQKKNNSHRPLPDDFPKYINTGNPEKDQEDYQQRREQWIKENPELYKSYFTIQESSEENENITPQKISIK